MSQAGSPQPDLVQARIGDQLRCLQKWTVIAPLFRQQWVLSQAVVELTGGHRRLPGSVGLGKPTPSP